MQLKARLLEIEAGGNLIVVLGKQKAKELGVVSSDRVKLKANQLETMAILNIASEFPDDAVGVYREVKSKLGLKEGQTLQVSQAERPESLSFVREKIMGEKLGAEKMDMIVRDVVERHLSDVEVASFLTALQVRGMSMEETEAMSLAMVKSGKSIDFGKTPILDKHSIGGVPGDKTTLLVVPIIAAAGYTIPKSSSRAITSPAGTADRVEPLCPVDLTIDEILEVVKKTNACMVWGGALDLAPADDYFIKVEYPLSIDPMLLPSIMSKKKAMGSTHVVVDIPTGRGAKMKTIGQAYQLARDFIELGDRLGMQINCAVTEGEQPIGQAVGPVLEAREALATLMGRGPPDLIDKATSIAGMMLDMVGDKGGKRKAAKILSSGRAESKLRQIIEAQGGDSEIKLDELAPGQKQLDIEAKKAGRVLWINNNAIALLARTAGAPSNPEAGLVLRKKVWDRVSKNEAVLTIYAENADKLDRAERLAEELQPITIGKRLGETMLLDHVTKGRIQRQDFILER